MTKMPFQKNDLHSPEIFRTSRFQGKCGKFFLYALAFSSLQQYGISRMLLR